MQISIFQENPLKLIHSFTKFSYENFSKESCISHFVTDSEDIQITIHCDKIIQVIRSKALLSYHTWHRVDEKKMQQIKGRFFYQQESDIQMINNLLFLITNSVLQATFPPIPIKKMNLISSKGL
jgi:hypothetical protein